MNRDYTDVFFDLDRTLWDFDRNSRETLEELFIENKLSDRLEVKTDEFVKKFKEINAVEWRDFRSGGISKEEMRTNRFVQTFFHFGSGDWKLARKLSRDYIEICPYKKNLVPGAKNLLESTKDFVKLHVITNGFSDTQRIKLKASGLMDYFDVIIISDETKFRKPQREIFLEGLSRAQAKISQSIMIGDDWQKDIQGAKRIGLDQVFFNPEKKGVLEEGSCTYEIDEISKAEDIIRNST